MLLLVPRRYLNLLVVSATQRVPKRTYKGISGQLLHGRR